MFNLDERKLMLILAHEEYEHLLAEKKRLAPKSSKFVRGNKQDRLIQIEKDIQLTQQIIKKLESEA
jgi:hypothetical protein